MVGKTQHYDPIDTHPRPRLDNVFGISQFKEIPGNVTHDYLHSANRPCSDDSLNEINFKYRSAIYAMRFQVPAHTTDLIKSQNRKQTQIIKCITLNQSFEIIKIIQSSHLTVIQFELRLNSMK